MPNKAGSNPALRNETDPEYYHGKTFSLFAPSRSHTHRCQTPLSSVRIRPPEHASCIGSHLQARPCELLRPGVEHQLSVRQFLTLYAARPPSSAPRSQVAGPHRLRPAVR
jgi:hypothetical protein